MKNMRVTILIFSLVVWSFTTTPVYAYQDCNIYITEQFRNACEEENKRERRGYLILGGALIGGLIIWAFVSSVPKIAFAEQDENNVWEDVETTFSYNDESEAFKTGLKYTINY